MGDSAEKRVVDDELLADYAEGELDSLREEAEIHVDLFCGAPMVDRKCENHITVFSGNGKEWDSWNAVRHVTSRGWTFTQGGDPMSAEAEDEEPEWAYWRCPKCSSPGWQCVIGEGPAPEWVLPESKEQ